jgi:hypothetical protein
MRARECELLDQSKECDAHSKNEAGKKEEVKITRRGDC